MHECVNRSGRFFFLRLPIGQYGPVSQLSNSENKKETVQVHLIGTPIAVEVSVSRFT